MKRSGPLRRTTPMRRVPIKGRRSTLQPKALTAGRHLANPRKKPKVQERPAYDSEFWNGQRKILWHRSGGLCERCGVPMPAHGMEAHHRLLRSQGGGHEITNLVALCTEVYGNGCHTGSNGVHSRRTAAVDTGFIVPSWGNPAARAVVLHDGRTVRLLEDGTYDTLFDQPAT